MFTGKEIFEDVKVYTDWRPEIIMYKRLADDSTHPRQTRDRIV
jgi:hypothetical protein